MVDIVIGTHRVLSKDVEFKDLGLLIIDEEQHFGVGHKEQLKKLKSNVHVLTLTATPIPRTLNAFFIVKPTFLESATLNPFSLSVSAPRIDTF